MIYRVREPGKTGGRQFSNIEDALYAAMEWFDDTGIKCLLECCALQWEEEYAVDPADFVPCEWIISTFQADYLEHEPALIDLRAF